jgi:predicted acylesterase/phospholipase RssA
MTVQGKMANFDWSPVKTLIISCCLVGVATGCVSLPERNPLPASLGDEAEIPGIPKARYWADEPSPYMSEWFELSSEELKARYAALFGRAHNYLAISGGGPRGAFAAGLLNGWTAAGTRPEFALVTGVSTGALMAPFAFLGPDYDHMIKKFYTEFSTKDLMKERGKLKALFGDAAADSAPLRQKIAEFIDEDVMAAIAVEHAKGRILAIGTTNLDAGRAVTWNIGRIAASGAPNALDLIHDILLASASVPAAFPPVMFTVEAGGQHYDEMHVDGGVTSLVYLYPLGLDWDVVLGRLEVPGRPNVFVIRNGYLKEGWASVKRNSIYIAARSIDALMQSAVYGDMYRIYLATRRDGLAYHLAFIPESFDAESSEPFDPEYMTELFNLGYEMARDGYPWKSEPPGYDAEVN